MTFTRGQIVRYCNSLGEELWFVVDNFLARSEDNMPTGPLLWGPERFKNNKYPWNLTGCKVVPLNEVPKKVSARLAAYRLTDELTEGEK